MKSGFKRTINWNKYQSQVTIQRQKESLDYLIDSSFQELYRLFGLTYDDNAHQTSCKRFFLPAVEIKNYNFTIDGQISYIQPIKNVLRTYDNIRKIATGQRDDYTTGCLLDHPCFKEHYKMIAIYLSK